jgi:hypothetical protein
MPKRTRTTSTSSPDVWVSGLEAQRIAGFTNWYALHKLVMLGQVRIKADPGCPIRYHSGDVERHKRQRVKA